MSKQSKSKRDKITKTSPEAERPLSGEVDVRFSNLVNQSYPLIIDFDTAEEIVKKIHALVEILKPGQLNKKEYELLNEVTSSLLHPSPIVS